MPDDLKLSTQQIARTSSILGLEESVIEKDFYVTKLIHLLADVHNDYYQLVFQGGTALSKAHQVIPRMSEDVDFRVAYGDKYGELGRHGKRKKLRDLRHKILELVEQEGFTFHEKPRVYYEGNYTVIKLDYNPIYKVDSRSSVKNHISLDLFVSELKTPPVEKPVTTLIRNTLGDTIAHPDKTLSCMSLLETAAEKWVGLTRRIDEIRPGDEEKKHELLRHLYDLHKINQEEPLNHNFHKLVKDVLIIEANRYKKEENAIKNHIKKTQRVLDELHKPIWKNNWNVFIEHMVYEPEPVSYEKALDHLFNLSRGCVKQLKQTNRLSKNILLDLESQPE